MCQGKILDVLKDVAKCNRKELIAFMTSLLRVFVKGEQAAIAYHQWTGEEGSSYFVDRLTKTWTEMHDDLEAEYEKPLEYCKKNFISYMKDEVDTMSERTLNTGDQDVANMIQQHVSTKYDWLEFSVLVGYQKTDNRYDWKYMHDCGNDYYGQSTYHHNTKSPEREVYIGWRDKSPMSAMLYLKGSQIVEDSLDVDARTFQNGKVILDRIESNNIVCRYIFAISEYNRGYKRGLYSVNATESDGSFFEKKDVSLYNLYDGYGNRNNVVILGIDE